MQLLAALTVCVRGGVGLSGDSFLYAITYCGGRSVDECRDFLLDKGSKRPPQIGDTGNNPSDDVFADMSPFLHAAVPCTDKFGDAGIGGLKQIFDAVKDAVYQCGEHCCTTFQNVGQMGNEGSGKPGNKVRCRCDEVWQTVRDTDDEIFQQLDTAVENIILMICQIVKQLSQKVRNSRYSIGYLLYQSVGEAVQQFGCGVHHCRDAALRKRIRQCQNNIVCDRKQVGQRRIERIRQRTQQSLRVIGQGGQPAVEGLAGLQHTVVELSALAGGSGHGGFQLIEADLAVRDALVEGAHALAGGVADLIERVEARVDHHVDVFQRDLLGAGHLAIGPHEGLELVRVAQRNIAQTFQYAGGVVRRDAELQEGLGPLGQVGQGEGRACGHPAYLFQLLGGKLFVAQHDLEVGQIAFHAAVVVQTALDHALQAGCSFLGKVRDELACGHRPLARGFLSRVAVELYFAGNAKICGHGVHLSLRKRAQAQWHRLRVLFRFLCGRPGSCI